MTKKISEIKQISPVYEKMGPQTIQPFFKKNKKHYL